MSRPERRAHERHEIKLKMPEDGQIFEFCGRCGGYHEGSCPLGFYRCCGLPQGLPHRQDCGGYEGQLRRAREAKERETQRSNIGGVGTVEDLKAYPGARDQQVDQAKLPGPVRDMAEKIDAARLPQVSRPRGHWEHPCPCGQPAPLDGDTQINTYRGAQLVEVRYPHAGGGSCVWTRERLT